MSKYSKYFAIEKKLKAQGFDGDRQDLIESFTSGEKSSLKELSYHDYREFCNWLTTAFKVNDPAWQNTPENKMRRKIYSLFVHKMSYTKTQLDFWCEKYGKFKKPLSKHNYQELVQLVSQAERVYASYINNLSK